MADEGQVVPPTRKRIVLCCDGTWNKPDADVVTNIEKIARTVQTDRPCPDGVQQVVEYVAGVGVGYAADRILGGAFGLGLFNNVRNAYRFLALNYAPGDEVFVFGFSRGAYTARSVAGLVGSIGLLTRAGMIRDGVLRQALDLYRLRPAQETPEELARRKETIAAFRAEHCHPAETTTIRFLGVFDTVGALGVPGMLRTGHQFHDITLGRGVELARQALAIDERRRVFEPCLWAVPTDEVDLQVGSGTGGRPRVKQVWFAGAHSDVGGGYPEQGLSNSTLRWMSDEARAAGLVFGEDDLAAYLGSRSEACVHDSLQPKALYSAINARERLRGDLASWRHPGVRSGVFLPDGRRDLEPAPPLDPGGRDLRVPVAMASTACEDASHGYRPSNVSAYVEAHRDPFDPTAYEPAPRLPDGSLPPTPAAVRRRRRRQART